MLFFFNDPATTEIYTLSLHDALPISLVVPVGWQTEIDFRNHDGVLPHSAEVIAPQTPPPALPGDPAIPRASTLKLGQGLPSGARDDMRFAAQPAADDVVVCGVRGAGAA